nr:MAG TPA: hypothetical protein [Caudoviricetes sp.]
MPPSAGLSMRNSPRGTSSATRSPYSGRNGRIATEASRMSTGWSRTANRCSAREGGLKGRS